jgi:phosphohistidine swiveling domain-containing protein
MLLSGKNTREQVPVAITWPTRIMAEIFDRGTVESLRTLGIPVADELQFIAVHNGQAYLVVDSMVKTMSKLPGWELETAGIDTEEALQYLPAELLAPPTRWERIVGMLQLAGMLLSMPRATRKLSDSAIAEDREETDRWRTRVAQSSTEKLAEVAGGLITWSEHLFEKHLLASMLWTQSWTGLEKACAQAGVTPTALMAGREQQTFSGGVPAGLQDIRRVCQEQGIDLDRPDAWEQLMDNPVTKERIEQFLERYGHHGFNTIEFASPRFSEEPELMVQAIQAQQVDLRRHAAQTGETARARVPQSHRRKVERAVQNVETRSMVRERTKDNVVRVADAWRTWCLKAAERLPEDVLWYMTIQEILDYLENETTISPSTLKERRELLASWRNIVPAETILLRDGVAQPLEIEILPESQQVLTGIVASGGQGTVEGRAVVATAPGEALQKLTALRKADIPPILITSATNVAWTALFGSLEGLITEVGGPASHAAIVAREYGIPAVVGVVGVVRTVPDGSWVRIDLDQGSVEWEMR